MRFCAYSATITNMNFRIRIFNFCTSNCTSYLIIGLFKFRMCSNFWELRSYCSRWSLGIKPLVWSIGYKRNDIWLDSLTTNYFPFLRKLSNWYPWHTECHGWSGDALRGVVSSHCGLSFFENSDELRRCHNLRCDGEMLKVACHEK